ncbi:hypothetical protein BJV77DRAFT_963553 [Russula vinacea]|nr:hypothetical protein BJV77DRAFT_963553 [Russula vinacea]
MRRQNADVWHQKGYGGCGEGNLEVALDVYQLPLQDSQQEKWAWVVRQGGNSRMCAQLKKIRGQRVREYTTSKHRTYSAERRSGAIHTIHALVARTVLSLLAGRIFGPENPERTQRSEVQVVLREEMTHVGCRAEACTTSIYYDGAACFEFLAAARVGA